VDKEKVSKTKKDLRLNLIKKEDLEIRKNSLKKTTQIKLILEIKKGSLKKTILENLTLKEKKSPVVIRTIQNILIKNLQMTHPQTQTKKNLDLIKRKNLRIEKDQTIFHLKNLEENKLISKTIIY